tara:strand:- start:51 stop:284 length:234 start_codon:yes stop_codon:yes gene_type:complete
MDEKIVTFNKKAIFNKLKNTGKTVKDQAKKKGGYLVNGVRTKAANVKDKIQNKIVDKSLAMNEKQAKIIERFRSTDA